jgi:MFS family permease
MLSNSIASILGPFISISLQNTGAYTEMFVFGTAMSAAALLMCLLMKKSEAIGGTGVRPAAKAGLSDYIERNALRVSLVMFLFFFTYSGVLTFIAPYGKELGLEFYASIFFIAVSVSTLMCRLFLGKVYDRYGENVALIPSLLMYIAGMFMIATLISGPEMLAAGLLIGVMVAMLNTVSQALVVRDIPEDRVSIAVSTLSIFWDMSFAVGPLVHGWLAYEYGYAQDYLVMAFIAIIAFIVYLVLVGIPGYRKRHC